MRIPLGSALLCVAGGAAAFPLPNNVLNGMIWLGEDLIKGTSNLGFPEAQFTLEGVNCLIFDPIKIHRIPRQCIYHVLCHDFSPPRTDVCFAPGTNPKGRLREKELFSLTDFCRKEALCGHPQQSLVLEDAEEVRRREAAAALKAKISRDLWTLKDSV